MLLIILLIITQALTMIVITIIIIIIIKHFNDGNISFAATVKKYKIVMEARIISRKKMGNRPQN